jgi:SAM-dependent methyltransferase
MQERSRLYDVDLAQTLASRERLKANANLMHWYKALYDGLIGQEPGIERMKVLEIGSGTSPLRHFLPGVITSDILDLDYLDIVFDCHQIADLDRIPDHSLDVITLTNVLHHLRDPLAFLRGAARKLARGGRVYMTEPYFSWLSYPMYKLLHHEPVDFGITRPVLNQIEGPLSTSNQAMPHMIFITRPEWRAELADLYDMDKLGLSYFTSLSYPATGGISRIFPVPHGLYRLFFSVDHAVARIAPRLFASFFTTRLVAAG